MQDAPRVYTNAGNPDALALLDAGSGVVLDVGCGAGDNARLLKRAGHVVDGVTWSEPEAALAAPHLRDCWVADLELGLPEAAEARSYDAVLLCHVLEHLRHPEQLVAQAARCLRPGGVAIIAVPNVLNLRQRWQFLTGRFEYQSSGVLDSTHLRFFTHDTAPRMLLSMSPSLALERRAVTASVPLWLLRRHVLPSQWSKSLDALGGRLAPGLFGGQLLLRARKVA